MAVVLPPLEARLPRTSAHSDRRHVVAVANLCSVLCVAGLLCAHHSSHRANTPTALRSNNPKSRRLPCPVWPTESFPCQCLSLSAARRSSPSHGLAAPPTALIGPLGLMQVMYLLIWLLVVGLMLAVQLETAARASDTSGVCLHALQFHYLVESSLLPPHARARARIGDRAIGAFRARCGLTIAGRYAGGALGAGRRVYHGLVRDRIVVHVHWPARVVVYTRTRRAARINSRASPCVPGARVCSSGCVRERLAVRMAWRGGGWMHPSGVGVLLSAMRA